MTCAHKNRTNELKYLLEHYSIRRFSKIESILESYNDVLYLVVKYVKSENAILKYNVFTKTELDRIFPLSFDLTLLRKNFNPCEHVYIDIGSKCNNNTDSDNDNNDNNDDNNNDNEILSYDGIYRTRFTFIENDNETLDHNYNNLRELIERFSDNLVVLDEDLILAYGHLNTISVAPLFK